MAQAQSRLQQDALDNLQARSNVVQGAGARAYGMGGAFLARPDDATAASWNPAGLSYLRSPELSLVGTHSTLKILQRDIDRTVTRGDRLTATTPDFMAGTLPLEVGAVTGSVQLSYQRVISFDGDRTIVRDSPIVRHFEYHGGFDVVGLSAGAQVRRRLRLGLTLNRWLNGYRYVSERQGGNRPASQQSFNFDFAGWNVNLGTIWSPVESLNLGAVYKTGFAAEAKLRRQRTDFGTTITNNQYASDSLSLDFPAAFGVGASWRPRSPLTLSADYTRTNWSSARIHNYFTLPPTGTPQAPDDLFRLLAYPALDAAAPQKDTQQFRAGVEYVVIKSRLKWPLRVGYVADSQLFQTFNAASGAFDKTPVYHAITAGSGVIVGRLLIDLAYVYTFGSYREIDLEASDPTPQDNSVRSHRVFVSLIYRHKR